MQAPSPWDNKAIICDVLGKAPDVELGSAGEGWSLCRWRQFVSHYTLPPLPDRTFIVHIAGKPQVRTWERDGWSSTSSVPGCATLIPEGMPTAWLVDGELDVVTLSLSAEALRRAPATRAPAGMRFAFADPLGAALARQILAELYAPQDVARRAYVSAMVQTLTLHALAGAPPAGHAADIPVSDVSAFRLHRVMNAVQAQPHAPHALEDLAALAGLSPAHFSRLFRKATGMAPHQFVLKARLDHAQHLLVQTALPLASVAELAGFASQSHFSRAFRSFAGVTPRAYRAQACQYAG